MGAATQKRAWGIHHGSMEEGSRVDKCTVAAEWNESRGGRDQGGEEGGDLLTVILDYAIHAGCPCEVHQLQVRGAVRCWGRLGRGKNWGRFKLRKAHLVLCRRLHPDKPFPRVGADGGALVLTLGAQRAGIRLESGIMGEEKVARAGSGFHLEMVCPCRQSLGVVVCSGRAN